MAGDGGRAALAHTSLHSGSLHVRARLAHQAHARAPAARRLAPRARHDATLHVHTLRTGMTTFGEGANAMAVLFFVVLYCLGLDSTFAWAETVTAYAKDYFALRGAMPAPWKILAVQCLLFFVVGLPFCTRLGGALLDVTDHFSVAYVLLLGNFIELVMFNCDFHWERFLRAIRQATASATKPAGRVLWPSWWWKLSLRVAAPLLTLGLFLDLLYEDLRVRMHPPTRARCPLPRAHAHASGRGEDVGGT